MYKARRLRHETGNWALHAEHEEWDVGLKELAEKYLIRPFQLLMTPICFLVALYASFVYGILYLGLGGRSLALSPLQQQKLTSKPFPSSFKRRGDGMKSLVLYPF